MAYQTASEMLEESARRDQARARLAAGEDLTAEDVAVLSPREVSAAVERGLARNGFGIAPRRQR